MLSSRTNDTKILGESRPFHVGLTQTLKDAKLPGGRVVLPDVREVAALNLEAGSDDSWTCMEPLAVLAASSPKVELVPQLSGLDL